MGRKWTDSQRKALEKYDAINTIQFKMKLNKKHDADIIERLNQSGNKQGYIKRLVREDIKKDG